MALTDAESKEQVQEEFDDIETQLEKQDKEHRNKQIVGWLFSAATHLGVVILAASIYFTVNEPEIAVPPIRIAMLPQQDKPKETEKKLVTSVPLQVEVETTKVADVSTVTDIVLADTNETANNDVVVGKQGREDAVSSTELGSTGAFSAIGAGGGAAGIFGNRNIGGRKRSFTVAYSSHAKEASNTLDLALQWLSKHQSVTGEWSADKYNVNCNEDPKCEPGKANVEGADVALTGLSLLSYLGAGYDHKTPNRYRNAVKNGLNWLISKQAKDGSFGKRNYEHPIATMAIIEALQMTGDPELKKPAELAFNYMLSKQSIDGKTKLGIGWDYINPNEARIDYSVTCWNIMSCKSAYGLFDITKPMAGSKVTLEKAWKAANPKWKEMNSYSESIFPYTYNNLTDTTEKDYFSFVGSTCGIFLGYRENDIMLDSMVNDMNKRWLATDKWKNNSYVLYYAALAQFQYQKHWKEWMEAYIPYLIDTQYKNNGCLTGSWKFAPQQYHGSDTSRILNHCLYTLSLEVAQRYTIIHKK